MRYLACLSLVVTLGCGGGPDASLANVTSDASQSVSAAGTFSYAYDTAGRLIAVYVPGIDHLESHHVAV